MTRSVASHTAGSSYFEDFAPGQKIRHSRGATVGEFENQMLTKLVMNTADAHFNEARMVDTAYGQRLVFGLVTGSMIVGLATQDIAENAIAELEMDGLRFRAPVFHDDSLTAYTEVLGVADADRDDAGVVHFKHWGAKQDGTVVFEGERKVLIKRRSHWSDR